MILNLVPTAVGRIVRDSGNPSIRGICLCRYWVAHISKKKSDGRIFFRYLLYVLRLLSSDTVL
eukprot:SAG11_NODE_18036_length_501_cov_2.756219_1_plen_62_part_10